MEIRLLAAGLFGLLAALATLILKNEPIRNEEAERERAVLKVKKFAQFIEQRPDLARVKPRTVLDAKTADFLPRPVGQAVISEAQVVHQPRQVEVAVSKEPAVLISELGLPESRAQFEAWVKQDPARALRYFEEYFQNQKTADSMALNEVWSDHLEGLMLVAHTAPNANVLDVALDQLIFTREHGNDVQKYVADQWFEQYMKLEKRPQKLQEAIDAFGQQVIRQAQ